MKIETKKTFEILVPYIMGNHDGSDISKPKRKKNIPLPYHKLWDEKCKKISKGLTICKVVKGIWENSEGTVYKELMIPVRIACSEDQIIEIMKMTAEHYEQEAIYCSCVSERTFIYNRNAENDPALEYDPKYGDQTKCKCGCNYYRHFDTGEYMMPTGCKYCRDGDNTCLKFEKAKAKEGVNLCYAETLRTKTKEGTSQ